MKKFSFTPIWSVAALAIAVLMFGSVGSKTFATIDYTPVECSSPMNYYNITGGNASVLTGGIAIGANTIFVVESGTYNIEGNITMGECSVLVTSGDVTFNMGAGSFMSTSNKFTIRGQDENNRLHIINAGTGLAAIMIENRTGVTISYTQISGFTGFGGIVFNNISNSTISNNIITNNLDGINIQGSSLKNIISNNNISYNSDNGIRLEPGVLGQSISNNNINYNTHNGIFLNRCSNNIISNNTGINNNQYGIYFYNTSSNTGINNIISGSIIGMYFEGSNNNRISANGIEHNSMGIIIENSNYNVFSGVNVINNTDGTTLNASSNNTLNLTNNNNGIIIEDNSNNNSIYNKQAGNIQLNNISISNGSNNTITGGLFTVSSTTSTSVNINLRNNQGTPTYTITGAGLSGTYPTTAMNGSTGTVAIELTATNNEVKNIVITYNNGNTQYDTITLGTTTSGGESNGGGAGSAGSAGGGGGGGGSSLSTCTATQLICSGNVRVQKPGTSCQGGNLGLACSIGSGIITGSVLSGSILGSTYSTELNNAYLWSYANGITTMNTIQKANMGDTLIRSHMAKMISNFAIKLGGLTLNTGAKCNFTDIANQSTEMKTYIKISCQLGLMGVDMTNFNPNDEITRAQFGTILSRVIWGTRNNSGTPYYLAHLQALKLAGIMTQISNPNMEEIRGYVMLMMMRTYEGGFLHN